MDTIANFKSGKKWQRTWLKLRTRTKNGATWNKETLVELHSQRVRRVNVRIISTPWFWEGKKSVFHDIHIFEDNQTKTKFFFEKIPLQGLSNILISIVSTLFSLQWCIICQRRKELNNLFGARTRVSRTYHVKLKLSFLTLSLTSCPENRSC